MQTYFIVSTVRSSVKTELLESATKLTPDLGALCANRCRSCSDHYQPSRFHLPRKAGFTVSRADAPSHPSPRHSSPEPFRNGDTKTVYILLHRICAHSLLCREIRQNVNRNELARIPFSLRVRLMKKMILGYRRILHLNCSLLFEFVLC